MQNDFIFGKKLHVLPLPDHHPILFKFLHKDNSYFSSFKFLLCGHIQTA